VHPRAADEIKVGVLGLGELGGAAAIELVRQGFDVRGWSRSSKSITGVRSSAGLAALPAFLADLDIVVVMLPSTPETDGLFDADHLLMLPKGAAFINVSRGSIVDEPALLAALASGHLSGATLDVFAKEPLTADHPFWSMSNVLVTPHLASVAVPNSASEQIAENIRRTRSSLPPLHRVDPIRGY
jgi:glyoxylate/hydroxypyruvate reductase A